MTSRNVHSESEEIASQEMLKEAFEIVESKLGLDPGVSLRVLTTDIEVGQVIDDTTVVMVGTDIESADPPASEALITTLYTRDGPTSETTLWEALVLFRCPKEVYKARYTPARPDYFYKPWDQVVGSALNSRTRSIEVDLEAMAHRFMRLTAGTAPPPNPMQMIEAFRTENIVYGETQDFVTINGLKRIIGYASEI